MRRFRFVGDPNTFDWDQKPVMGDIYPETHFGTKNGVPWRQTFADGVDTTHWQEVFDHIGLPKPLHKDTDLGAFSAMFVASLINDPASLKMQTEHYCEYRAKLAIIQAQELIKQLDEQGQ